MENKKVERSVGGHEMTDEQKLRVLHATMKLQQAIFAVDSVENIPWFYCHKTKQTLKAVVTHILKEHGSLITALWGEGGAKMDDATMAMEEYNKEEAEIPYWRLPEVTTLLRKYKEGQFDDLFLTKEEEVQNGGE